MIRIRPEQFLPGIILKLHARGASPFKILKKVGLNGYVIDLPPSYRISILDLIEFEELTLIPNDPFEPVSSFESDPLLECPQLQLREKHDVIDHILDEQIKFTRDRDYHCYLVGWRGRLESDDFWITREELLRIDLNIFEHY